MAERDELPRGVAAPTWLDVERHYMQIRGGGNYASATRVHRALSGACEEVASLRVRVADLEAERDEARKLAALPESDRKELADFEAYLGSDFVGKFKAKCRAEALKDAAEHFSNECPHAKWSRSEIVSELEAKAEEERANG